MEEIQLVKNRQNGKVVAAVVSIIFLLFFFLNLFSKSPPDPEEIAGIMIQFGEEDMGMEDDSDPFAEEPNLETFAKIWLLNLGLFNTPPIEKC